MELPSQEFLQKSWFKRQLLAPWGPPLWGSPYGAPHKRTPLTGGAALLLASAFGWLARLFRLAFGLVSAGFQG